MIALGLSQPADAIVYGYVSTTTFGNPAIYNSIPTVGLTAADVGKSFDTTWDLPASPSYGLSTDLHGTGHFTIESFDQTNLVIKSTITNTTDSLFQAAVMSLALAVDPAAVGSFANPGDAGAIFTQIGTGSGPQQTYPGGLKNVDVCVYSSNGCSGGKISSGLLDGYSKTSTPSPNSDTFTLTLTSTATGGFGTSPSATLGALGIKWQTQDGSFEMPATHVVPEPRTLLLFLIGFAGLIACRRWKRTPS